MNCCQSSIKFICLRVIPLFVSMVFFSSVSYAQSGNWVQKKDMPTARWGHASCTVDGKIYVIGGSDCVNNRCAALGIIEVYDPKTDSWDTSKEPMPSASVGFMAAVVDGVIYTIGGRTVWLGEDRTTVQAYDTRNNTWSMKSTMPHRRSVAGCCVSDGKIYIIGGRKDFSNYLYSNDLQIYDPTTDTWDDTKAKMNIIRGHLKTCISNDRMYAIGGCYEAPWFGLQTIEAYDKAANTWNIKTKLNEGRYNPSVNTINGLVYIFGGEYGTDPVYSVEVYDPVQDNCDIVDQSPMWFTLHSSSVYNSEIYLFGGSTTGEGSYVFTPSNKVYSYKLEPVSVESTNDQIDQKYKLEQAYPNPFNPETIIGYHIPINCNVKLSVYDLLGKEISTLVNEKHQPGYYEVKFDGQNLGSGTYFYQLTTDVSTSLRTNNYVETKKMILLK